MVVNEVGKCERMREVVNKFGRSSTMSSARYLKSRRHDASACDSRTSFHVYFSTDVYASSENFVTRNALGFHNGNMKEEGKSGAILNAY